MEKQNPPMSMPEMDNVDTQKSVSPPPPYPINESPSNLVPGSLPAVGFERPPVSTNISPPPPYASPVSQPPTAQVSSPYPIQQQPMYPTAVAYPPACPGPNNPLMGACQPIVSQPLSMAPSATVVLNAPAPVAIGYKSAYVQCPNCHGSVYTKTETEPSNKAIILCVMLCLFGCDLGCCLIPCCIDQLQDVDHRCPRCNYHIAHYKA